ncbi:MAG: NAD-dependent epimerase/dehydratase family protein [Richelia sp. RM2_1_2]|nr:NAD-dependent epimerase/dehydratase family protein [Richelia sp. SM1_7_0]NJN10357.1 NAD-dependent epimerase/dehydratase family protein [Richelia sp. RM1_1_1]NJO30384.1 NAD-dependent epimerase/dehydratase family protein [Richelia sp. SL_2_1]NJO62703.1 NAD-dependent epimerase/dehydratase family protein [Richelia sp. RM2_1_2]
MKALVTGANGFTGSHLVKALQQRGNSVVGLVRNSSNLTRLKDTEIQLVTGDITDRNALRQGMKDVDTVFHTAAFVELGLVDAAQMERVNVEGTQAVLEVAKEMEISKMVYCSTIGVYGDTKGEVINETFKRTQENFSSAYDSTKYKAQQLVDNYAVNGLPVVSVMPSGILGADDPHFGPVFKLFLQGKLKFWVGGDRITGVVHVDDLVNAMILAAEKGERGEHYIISAGEVPSREMFEIISKQTGISTPAEVPQPIVRVIGNILDPIGKILSWNPPIGKERVHYLYDRCVRVDASKAREKLGWQPRSVSQILQEIATQLKSEM